MSKMSSKPLFNKFLLVFAFCLSWFSINAQAAVLDRIIAVVNEGVVLQSDLDQALESTRQQIKSRNIPTPPEDSLRAQVLERLILVRVQTQRAQQAGIRIDDRELNEVMTGLAQRSNLTLTEFANELRRGGMDYLALREQVRDEVTVNRLRQREVDSRVLVTDQDIDLFLANRVSQDDGEYRLLHILVNIPDGATPDERGQARGEIEELARKIADGEDFSGIAIAHSDGQQALQGGDLDWRKLDDLPTLFAKQVVQMKTGEVSPVLEAAGGFHLIKLAAKRGDEPAQMLEEVRARHILLQSNTLRTEEQSRAQIRDLHERISQGEDFAELAGKFSDDPGSKNADGDLGWQSPEVYAPEFKEAVTTLDKGQLSDPFRTQFGWHIVEVLDRRTRDVTEEARRGQARAAIHRRKAAEEYDTWLRRLRDEAYIEYRLPGDDPKDPS